MKRVLAKELSSFIDQTVKLQGWLNNVRAMGKLNFLILRDRSGIVQVVITDKEQLKKVSALQPGSLLSIMGKVVSSPQSELGVEIIDPEITVDHPITDVPPIEYYKPEIPSDLEFILDHRSISLRNRKIQAVFKVQAEVAHAYRLYMYNTVGAVEYFAPNIIGASSEGGAEFFNVDYFGQTATLAQSSQLYKQIMVGVNERVFALMPFFRAENSNTSRHLTEGKQFEFEMGFFEHWHEILDIQEGCLKAIMKHVYAVCQKEIEILGGNVVHIPEDVPVPRISFKEAQQIYFERTGHDERDEPDLNPSAEKELCLYAKEKFGTDLIFITDWKAVKRPFYSFLNEDNPELTNTFDLLCAGTEITSGGQRRHTYDSMVEGILSKGMDPDNFEDYLSIFKYGMPPHGGFGMGLERLTMTILKLGNIREASLFPSDPKRIAGTRLKAKIFFGGENIRNEIVRLMRQNHYEFQHLKHDDKRREGGVKSILLRGKTSKKNYQVILPVHLKLDMKALAQQIGEKCEMESPETIEERFGLQVGGVPPFGQLLNLDIYFDESMVQLDDVTFNCGLPTESIVMKGQDLIELVQPKIGRFAKDS